MKYYVLGIKWDSKKQSKAKYIAGEFPEYYLAEIFKDAYNEHFKSCAVVVAESELVNAQ